MLSHIGISPGSRGSQKSSSFSTTSLGLLAVGSLRDFSTLKYCNFNCCEAHATYCCSEYSGNNGLAERTPILEGELTCPANHFLQIQEGTACFFEPRSNALRAYQVERKHTKSRQIQVTKSHIDLSTLRLIGVRDSYSTFRCNELWAEIVATCRARTTVSWTKHPPGLGFCC